MPGPSRPLAGALVLATALGLLLATPARAADDSRGDTIVAEAIAEIPAGDRVRARDKAMRRALEEAVMTAARRVVGETAWAEHETAIRARLLLRAASFVRTYEVVREDAGEDHVTVAVSATVAMERLRKELRSYTDATSTTPVDSRRWMVIHAGDSATLAASARRVLSRLGWSIATDADAPPRSIYLEARVSHSEMALSVRGTSILCIPHEVHWWLTGSPDGAAARVHTLAVDACDPEPLASVAAAWEAPLTRSVREAFGGVDPGDPGRLVIRYPPNARLLLALLDRLSDGGGTVRIEELTGDQAIFTARDVDLALLVATPPAWLATFGLVPEPMALAPTLHFTRVDVEVHVSAAVSSEVLVSLRSALRSLPGLVRLADVGHTAMGAPILRVWHPGGHGAIIGALSAWSASGGSALTPRLEGERLVLEVGP